MGLFFDEGMEDHRRANVFSYNRLVEAEMLKSAQGDCLASAELLAYNIGAASSAQPTDPARLSVPP